MIYGLYLSAQGAEVQSVRQDVLSHNLANASTPSFKRSLVLAQSHVPFDVAHGNPCDPPGDLNNQTGGVSILGTPVDYSQGGFDITNGKFDIALAGPGFYKVSGNGQNYLTRDGRLNMDRDGRLTLRETGQSVVGTNGTPILLDPSGLPPMIGSDGTISQGSTVVGQLSLVSPPDVRALQRVGDNLYLPTGREQPTTDTSVKQGALEISGARPVIEMMELIESSRMFEANVNMIKYQDESLGKLIESLPRR
ncbi:MAG: flagellar hook-basal body protein [Planctomycetales bacterium]